MTTLTDIRTRVRRDLHDEDASNYRWTDAELDRHIDRALRELGLAIPLEATASLTTAANSRDISVAALTDRVTVDAVEYPTGEYPPAYVRFSLWVDTLTLLVDREPVGGESVSVFYGKLHTLDSTGSSLPQALEDLLATGAAWYAALEWATFATNRVNVGGQETWHAYLTWGRELLAAFRAGLATHGRRGGVRPRQLYAPAQTRPSQTTDWGP